MEGICFFCVTLSYFTLLPVTVERSVSVYMLGHMATHEKEDFFPEQFEQIFYDNYVVKNKAMLKRFKEQEITGSIEKDEKGYRITTKGKYLVKLFYFVGKLFKAENKNISEL